MAKDSSQINMRATQLQLRTAVARHAAVQRPALQFARDARPPELDVVVI